MEKTKEIQVEDYSVTNAVSILLNRSYRSIYVSW